MNSVKFYMRRHGFDGNITCICGKKFNEWVVDSSAHEVGLAAISATCSVCGCNAGQSIRIEKDKLKEFQNKIKQFVKQF